ncbi:MAG: DeoR/GlpR family DNA-binding transcription regulator [Bacillota bacterium]|nr:DeoR/GlpR family DNA-binding transcription regulator [Bacillota bacterium]
MQDRREQMAKYIAGNKQVTILKLEELFPAVSEMTIRRDLEYLEKRGDIIRVKGGAKSVSLFMGMKEDAYSKREASHITEKEEIANKAFSMITNERSIYLDPGTTAMALAKLLSAKNIFAVTSAPNIALELMKNPLTIVNVVGGELNRENLSLSGQGALDFVDSINIEIVFAAASGFTEATGFTCGSQQECILKQKVLKKALKRVVLMDSTKDGVNMPFTFARPEDIDVFISDSNLKKQTKKYFKDKGVKIL